MNRETAIDLLDNLIGMVEDNQENDYDEALKMGMDALYLLGKYDCVWEEIKCAGEQGREVLLHRFGRVYIIREVAT